MILCIESAEESCSVALFGKDNKLLSHSTEATPRMQASILAVLVQEVLATANVQAQMLTAIAVSAGPGSYTGLRIGVSTAKGLAYSLNIPLIAINTLKIIATAALMEYKGSDYIIPMIDARRDEVYAAIFDNQLNNVQANEAIILTPESFEKIAQSKVLVIGSGAEKAKAFFEKNTSWQYLDIRANAIYMTEALAKFNAKDIVDTAYFEPDYIKEYHLTI